MSAFVRKLVVQIGAVTRFATPKADGQSRVVDLWVTHGKGR